MCLYTRQMRARRAEKDIICYKTVWKRTAPKNKGTFLSKYKNFIYKLGETYTEPMFAEIPENWGTGNEFGAVKFGFHSYTDLRTAMEDMYYHEAVIRCVIPKGALYYGDQDSICYCSKTIRIIGWRERGDKDWRVTAD